jgi:hypothetical protein
MSWLLLCMLMVLTLLLPCSPAAAIPQPDTKDPLSCTCRYCCCFAVALILCLHCLSCCAVLCCHVSTLLTGCCEQCARRAGGLSAPGAAGAAAACATRAEAAGGAGGCTTGTLDGDCGKGPTGTMAEPWLVLHICHALDFVQHVGPCRTASKVHW